MIDSEVLEPLRLRQTQIAKRRSDLTARMAKLRREDEALAVEDEEISTTLKTLARVYGVELDEAPETRGKSSGGISTKPEGTPTLFEMVTTVLHDYAEIFSDDPIEGDTIFEEIRRRWWPDAPRNSIIPSLWRFAKEDRLIKDGTAYGLLPKHETSGAATPDVSMSEEDLDDEIPF